MKIIAATRPENASALAMTINSICVELDCFAEGACAAVRAIGLTAGCDSGVASVCRLAAGSSAAGCRSFDELTSEPSGQRDAIADLSAEAVRGPVSAAAMEPVMSVLGAPLDFGEVQAEVVLTAGDNLVIFPGHCFRRDNLVLHHQVGPEL